MNAVDISNARNVDSKITRRRCTTVRDGSGSSCRAEEAEKDVLGIGLSHMHLAVLLLGEQQISSAEAEAQTAVGLLVPERQQAAAQGPREGNREMEFQSMRLALWMTLPKARPISCNDSPDFQRRHISIRCSAERIRNRSGIGLSRTVSQREWPWFHSVLVDAAG